jgi:hypothetical protein
MEFPVTNVASDDWRHLDLLDDWRHLDLLFHNFMILQCCALKVLLEAKYVVFNKKKQGASTANNPVEVVMT